MKIELDERQQRLVLESLRVHSDEGWFSLGHYGFDGNADEAVELGRRLCRSLSIDLEGREWLK